MASIVPSLSPAGSTMVRPCQAWTVSILGAGMQLPFLWRAMAGWLWRTSGLGEAVRYRSPNGLRTVLLESEAGRQPRRCRIPRFGVRDGGPGSGGLDEELCCPATGQLTMGG